MQTMSTLLRPSTRHVAQLTTASLRSSLRPFSRIARTPRLPATQCLRQLPTRYYSTKAPEPPPRKDQGKAKQKPNKENKRDQDHKALGKQESSSKEPSSELKDSEVNTAKAEPDTDKDAREPLPPGWVHLNEKQLAGFIAITKIGPQSQTARINELKDVIIKYGVPQELAGLLDKHDKEGLSIMDSMQVLKLAYKLASHISDKEAEKTVNTSGPFTSHQPKPEDENEDDSQASSRSNEDSSSGARKKKASQKGEQQQGQEKGSPQPSGGFFNNDIATWIVVGITVYALNSLVFSQDKSREITWQELRKNFLDKGLVEKLVVSHDRVRVELDREATKTMYPDSVAGRPNFNFYFTIGSVEAFEKRVEDAQTELGIPASERIPISYATTGWVGNMLMAFGPTLLLIGLLYYGTRRSMGGGGGGPGGVFGFGKSKAKRFNHETAVKVKFSDVAGLDEAKVEIMEFVSFLKQPEKFQRLGAKIPRGAILAGPPGTGKTLLAKATAGESEVPFFSVSGSEFVEMFVGVGASRVRDLFATARKSAPCIVFIDEIDAIGKARESGGRFGGNEEREATLNQILTEMDGFNTAEQVVVLAGTNRPEILDQALMRPGRFDRHINIDRPTMSGRKDVFKVYLAKITTKEDMDYLTGRLAALTPGFAGADIANAVNEAALIAARANADSVQMIHFEQAIERVVGGLERKSLVLNPKEKKTVAYHEAGHAICGWYFEWADPLLKVSIIPRGQGALGYAQYLPGDAYLMTEQQLMDRMAMTLGGRISEEMHFETVTTGASDDFRKVTAMATKMVTEWGMSSKIGPLSFKNDPANQVQKPFAETTAQAIDAEVRRIVDAAYKQCRDLLEARKTEVGLVAEELLRKEVLTRDDMVRLLGERPFEDPGEFAKYFNNDAPAPYGGGSPPPTEPVDDGPPAPAAPVAPTVFRGVEQQR